MQASNALIIGSGLGGLATAIRLAHRGYAVTVLEKNATLGGRSGIWSEDGFRFDTGPTLLMMVDELRELFASVDRRLEDYLELTQLHPNYRIHFSDGSHFDNSSLMNEFLAEVERLEPGSGPRALEFLALTQRLYQIGRDEFVGKNFTHWHQFLNPKKLAQLFQVRAHENLYRLVGRYFQDQRLREAFSFQSMYLGLSPYESPGVYGLLPFTEVGLGLWFPKGGLYAIVEALEQLGRELGVCYQLNWEVTDMVRANGRVQTVVARDGRQCGADLVIANADLPYVYQELLPADAPGARRPYEYTCSGFLMYLGVEGSYPQLKHHNLFVPRDLPGYFKQVFDDQVVPTDPAYYICNPSKTDPELAPEGHENIYVLVPVPHLTSHIDWQVEAPRYRDAMIDRMERWGLTDLRSRIKVERLFTPDDFRHGFNSAMGSAFGLAHTIPQIGYFRPHNRHQTLENLYFVGCSTQPGTGIPMVIIGSRLLAERIDQEHTLVPHAPAERITLANELRVPAHHA